METRSKQLKNTDLAYIAGFIDGEGTIGIFKVEKTNAAHKAHWNPSYRLRLFITQTSLVPLHYIRDFYPGGYITLKKRYNLTHKDCFTLGYTGKLAAQILKDCRPYMMVKDKEADLALDFIDNMVLIDRSLGKRLLPQEVERREVTYQKMKELNRQRGRPAWQESVQLQRASEKASKKLDEAVL